METDVHILSYAGTVRGVGPLMKMKRTGMILHHLPGIRREDGALQVAGADDMITICPKEDHQKENTCLQVF